MESFSIVETLATLSSIVAFVIAATGYAGRLWTLITKGKKVEGTAAKVLSWVIGIGVCLYGANAGVGMFGSEPFLAWTWYVSGTMTGVAVSLAANGVFKTDEAKAVLEFVLARKKKRVS